MTAETMILELPPELYVELESLAIKEKTDPVELIARLLERAKGTDGPPTPAFQRILDRATDFGVADLAAQHDHYLYGVEKR